MSSPIGAAIAEWLSPIANEPFKAGGTANKSNELFNAIYKRAGKIGPILMVAGAGMSAYKIGTPKDPAMQGAIEAGGWAGALGVGYAFAKGGALIGTVIGGPVGGAIGSVAGGIAGAILGCALGESVGQKAYSFFF